jgi:hypothetical protein
MGLSEDKIKKAFKHKTWNEIKASDSWQSLWKDLKKWLPSGPVYPYSGLPEQNRGTRIMPWPKR